MEEAKARGPVDVAGAAVRIGVSERYLREMVKRRRVPHYRIGRLIRFDESDLRSWLEERRVEAGRDGGGASG